MRRAHRPGGRPSGRVRAEFGVADAEAGRRKAEACVPCHGPQGNSIRPDVPSLAGQPPLYTYFQLIQFRDGRRSDPQMSPLVAKLSDTDMRDLAAYDAVEAPARAGRAPPLAGQKHIPRLAGQQEHYLVKQLRGFKAQTSADLDGTMTMAAQPLTEQEIETLAHYLAHLSVALGPPRP
ncbi:MAG: c-type cytochrome [Dehalococcoidia bacterium]|nr:c-type cytochrome [Dehalococcoidia bacterium]